jgi:hypothetical protein
VDRFQVDFEAIMNDVACKNIDSNVHYKYKTEIQEKKLNKMSEIKALTTGISTDGFGTTI